ncbi:tyrosine-type recombinase/integrase [Enterococcus durans]|uniref:tyrosine-type recombinase/integrase n=1 Tax=Enterococcus durans TaxID=53345 RepID=UPI000E5D4D0E|nr:site-specific integrase [Enterococcus durans]RGW67494.1 site-specific integrase [Enterococcus durans]
MATIKSYTTKSGVEKWEYFVYAGTHKGKGYSKKIHKKNFATEKEARKAAKILEGELAAGTHKTNNPKQLSLSEYLDIWITQYKTNVKEGTRIVHRENIETYINPYIGNYKLENYDRSAHQAFINELLTKKGLGRSKQGLSYNTVKVVNATLSNAFKKAIQLGYINENPTLYTKFPKKAQEKVLNFYSLEQVDKFLEYAAKERDPLWYPFFLAIYDCGLRKAEVMALKWSDIDLRNKYIDVNKQRIYRAESKLNSGQIAIDNPKTLNSTRKMIMTDRAQQGFIDFYNYFYNTSYTLPFTKTIDDFIFIFTTGKSKGNIIRSRSTNGASDRIARKAGLPKIKVHDGRHTYAVTLRKAGVPLEDIKELLGHKDISTTQIYAQVSTEVIERASNKFNDYINNQERKVSGQIISLPKKDG